MDRSQKAIQVFEQALELSGGDLDDFLTQACLDDEALRADVESLLAVAEDAEGFLPVQLEQDASTVRPSLDATIHGKHADLDGALRPGMELAGRYRVVNKIGAGGMGRVYRAVDIRLERDVAVKLLNATNLRDQDMQARFHREMKSVAGLSHPNIIALHDVADHGDVTFAVMEFVEGRTLRELISDGLELRQSLALARDIVLGLQAAHDRNIMHRDIKPENIILALDGKAKILDFGLARREDVATDAEPHIALESPQDITSASLTPGTVPYMSPEQANGCVLSCSTDVFSLGIVLFEMLTGVNPFRAATAHETMERVRRAVVPDSRDFVADISDELHTLLLSMLSIQPDRRPTTAEIIAQIDELRAARPVAKDPQPRALPSLAILPLKVAGGNEELTEVAWGLVENLTSILHRVPLLSLAAPSSHNSLDGMTPREIGNSLGVTFVVEGSMRQLGNSVAAGIRLIDARNGFQVWGHQFESADSSDHTTELLHAILPRLESQLMRAMSDSLKGQDGELSSQQLLLQGIGTLAMKGWHKAAFLEAADLLRASIRLDPTFALTHAYLALVNGLGHRVGILRESNEVVREAIAEAELALELDSMDSTVLGIAGCALADVGQMDRAIQVIKSAIDLNPNNAQAQAALGAAYMLEDRHDEAIVLLTKGIRISPMDKSLAVWYAALALAYFRTNSFDEAISAAQSGCESNDKNYLPRVILAAVFAARGETDEAAKAMKESLRVKPDLAKHEIETLVGSEYVEPLWALRADC